MSHAATAQTQKLVTELKVSGHLMTLEQGLFCVFHAPGSVAADPQSGLPGVRITHPPLQDRARLSISGFNEDGWIGAEAGAALVRVNRGPAQLLVTIYQSAAGQNEAPRLQVMRLGDVSGRSAAAALPVAPEPSSGSAAEEAAATGPLPAAAAPGPLPLAAAPPVAAPLAAGPPPAGAPGALSPAAVAPAAAVEGAEVAAHVQRRGDRLGKLGEWMGEPGSQSWIEGFAIAPNRLIGPEHIEYQAVLGKGWLSPWSEGGQYCGSRGMALPILGLRVRLKGTAAETHSLRVSATFTDGSRVGPISDADPAEAESLAPLEAFRVEILPHAGFEPDAADLDDEPEAEAASTGLSQPASGPAPSPAQAAAPAAEPQARDGRQASIAASKTPASKLAAGASGKLPAVKALPVKALPVKALPGKALPGKPLPSKPLPGKPLPGRAPVAKTTPGKPGRPARG